MLVSRFWDACTPRHLRRLAGERSYERGEDYAAAGRVCSVVEDDVTVTATVVGGEPYRVRVMLDGDGRLRGTCSCPVGAEGAFCKHCVATALAVSARHENEALRGYLAALSHDELVEFALAALARDDVLRDRVRLSMTGSAEALARAIDDAATVRDYVSWSEAWAHAERLDGVLDALELHSDPAEAVELAERFVRAVEAELGSIDDSSGVVGGTIVRALSLHLTACVAARPDPVALAERLFELEVGTDVLDDALDVYAEVLGSAGRARYRELAEAAWTGEPSWALSRIMERLAEGDVDRLVAIKARTVEHGWDYLEIARMLHDAGRVGEAVEWAERGVAADPDGRLREYLAETYAAQGRDEDALNQRATQFAELPSLATYQALCAAAEPLGRWPERRAAALATLDPRRSDLRVSILLWEGDVPGAWEQALAGGCSRESWRALARARPADAATVYRRLLEPTIRLTNDGAYREAVELLRELRALLVAHGREADHAALVAELRQVHRRKRNLMKLLDAEDWPCP